MTEDERRAFGDRITTLRHDLEMTQAEFAAKIGLPFGTVKSAEQGRFTPLPALVMLIRAAELDFYLLEEAAEREAELGPTVATPPADEGQ
jgi:transcriptional regulator with XRE-family HTH domain